MTSQFQIEAHVAPTVVVQTVWALPRIYTELAIGGLRQCHSTNLVSPRSDHLFSRLAILGFEPRLARTLRVDWFPD